ncbi:MAG TPA: hypothetical protein VMU39_08455 [Solirubrobacteraceae bacterium]|nr:hypothetical protein [Solirubrobacteraceae bacterium]
MSADEERSGRLFRFSQVELPWELGPPDGRYLLRAPGDPSDAPPAYVLVIATLGAAQRRGRLALNRKTQAAPEPEPALVATGRATIIDVAEPLADVERARSWLARAGDEELAGDLAVLNRALHAFRLATADPYGRAVSRRQLLVARVGFGVGERVADGLWTEARELTLAPTQRRRGTALQPQARLAAILTGRERALVCEELVLRARLDLDHGRDREAALQLLIALDAALAELALDPAAPALADRLAELREHRDGVAVAAQAALAGPLTPAERESIAGTLGRIEAALRARTVLG